MNTIHSCDDHTDVSSQQPESKVDRTRKASPNCPKSQFRILRWTGLGSHRHSEMPLRLRKFDFGGFCISAWRITLNDHPLQRVRPVSYDAVVPWVPAGESRIEARFPRPSDRTLEAVSKLSHRGSAGSQWFYFMGRSNGGRPNLIGGPPLGVERPPPCTR